MPNGRSANKSNQLRKLLRSAPAGRQSPCAWRLGHGRRIRATVRERYMTRALFALSLLALPTASLGAPVSAHCTPRIGAYVPLKDLIVTTAPATGLPARAKAETKLTIGGRLGLWMSPSFCLEAVADDNTGG